MTWEEIDEVRADMSEANDNAIAEHLREREEERLSLYHTEVLCSARYASRLLIEVVRSEGLTFPGIVSGFTPPQSWPHGRRVEGWTKPAPLGLMFKTHGSLRSTRDASFERRICNGGTVLRPPSHPRGAFGVWIAGDTLDACIDLGQARLVLEGSRCRLRLPPGIPHTLAGAMPGRTIDRMLSHPLFDGKGFVVSRVSLPPDADYATLSFACDLERIDMFSGPARGLGA